MQLSGGWGGQSRLEIWCQGFGRRASNLLKSHIVPSYTREVETSSSPWPVLCEVPVFTRSLIGSPIKFVDCLIGSPISSQSTVRGSSQVSISPTLNA